MRQGFAFSSMFLLFGIFLFCLTDHTTHGIDLEKPPNGPKGFFADNQKRTWAQANLFCHSQTSKNMSLATLDEATYREYTHLDGKWSTDFSGWYWTAATLQRTLDKFTWAPGTGIEPTAFGTTGRFDLVGSGSCLAFYSKPGSQTSHAISQPCDSPDGRTLCQYN